MQHSVPHPPNPQPELPVGEHDRVNHLNLQGRLRPAQDGPVAPDNDAAPVPLSHPHSESPTNLLSPINLESPTNLLSPISLLSPIDLGSLVNATDGGTPTNSPIDPQDVNNAAVSDLDTFFDHGDQSDDFPSELSTCTQLESPASELGDACERGFGVQL
ncbi:hypothetical protein OPT61_g2666 [Boeremia exigua]|uniref:Uncharacterized protein n=1 Tax=Boeremia exigua TaxID=749465 RepID=A0ACC2IKP7_9PLEO|nr:hypothetical protein OPT61_g2666 [Boeremia exigua]